ncbi:hypothetical protein Hypma_000615 [Hypsizygus marmoreus]|uniref:Extracellular serine-rich protein n=1 Tax=Hypsizygus marmoreus TaxID=39966 RepID=A0A369JEK8_HYPMA|nr:hypothetical protein Hypma_000615 [Hypsizygus marmoreus]
MSIQRVHRHFRPIAALSLLFSHTEVVFAQTNHNVTVGAVGSFYDPPTVSAAINDTVTFIFLGPAHSVIQADVWNPCVPSPGGFSSGLVQHVDEKVIPSTWTIKVTNDSQGIWFYCGNSIPISHCASGMVGAINPPSIASYNQYLSAAKQVTASPAPIPFSLKGNGASAASPPGPPKPTLQDPSTNSSTSSSTDTDTSSSTPTPSSSPSPSQTPTQSPSPTPTPSSSSTTARPTIIGASIGGSAILILLLTLLTCLILRRRRARRRDRPASKDFFRYKAQTPTLPSSSTTFSSARLVASPADRARLLQAASLGGSVGGTAQSTPVSLPIPLVPQRMGQASSSGSTSASQQSSSTSHAGMGTTRGVLGAFPAPPALGEKKGSRGSMQEREPANIQVLAREVAAVLMRDPQQAGRGGGAGADAGAGGSGDRRDSTGLGLMDRVESPAPPKYTRMSGV